MPRNGRSELVVSVAEQRRAQIIRAVLASIAEEGLDRTTMRNVADRAGVSTGTIAYYFKGKKEMVDAALLEASRQYMDRFNRENSPDSLWSLDDLVENFLAPDNADAGFVLQMIEVGLHNAELRGTHQWMVETGRANIERSIRLGMASGRFRPDIDPGLAAALLHGVLIWWGSELMSNATSVDMAREVARLALRLLESPPASAQAGASGRTGAWAAEGATVEAVRTLVLSDQSLPASAARALVEAFETLYAAMSRDGTSSARHQA